MAAWNCRGKLRANHMAKIAGYLADEVWLDEGSRLLLDLPSHWKTCLWGLGGMLAGLEVAIGTTADTPDGVITNHPETPPDADNVIALDLGPLALSWMGDPLASGVFDGSAEVMGSPDQLMDTVAPCPLATSRKWLNRRYLDTHW